MAHRNIVIGQKVTPQKVQRANEFRKHMTQAESALWENLRANRLNGWHFRRQQIIGGFIAHFYCHAAALVVEIDGGVHDYQEDYDQERTRLLADYGIDVIRFKNQAIFDNVEQVLGEIDRKCRERAARLPSLREAPPTLNV